MTRTLKALALLVAIAAVAGAGCTVEKQDAPSLSGPSELSLAITLYASPDTLRQDGASQSQITVQAQDGSGQAVKGLPIRLDIAVNGTLADFGQLSGKSLVTGGDGRATAAYTAPPAPADPVDSQTVVQILATPGGTDYGSATARSVSIRLVPPGVILPPNGTPVPSFTYAPSAPITKSDVTFDASLSTDSDGRIVAYSWNFGDGGMSNLVNPTHAYTNPGSYTATLTVKDNAGITSSPDIATVSVTSINVAGSISGFKINDKNGNGKWDIGESGISGWKIKLVGKNGINIKKEIRTNALGYYIFDNLPAGKYVVSEEEKKGWKHTTSTSRKIDLKNGMKSVNNNFTNKKKK